jgi:hypothetical protein
VEIVVVVAASAALALAALAVSVLLARRQAGLEAVEEVLARRQADHQARVATLEDRVAALEEARRAHEVEAGRRARVRARFDRSFRVLHLTNDGPAPARGVTVELRPIGAGRPPALDLGGLPVDLRPGQQLYLDAPESSPDGAAAMTATVRWTDDTGARDETFVLGTRF